MQASAIAPGRRPGQRRLTLELSTNASDIRQSQRLRHEISAEKSGISIRDSALDEDRFDAFCHHLLVRDYASREVIASARILTDSQARTAGSFNCETAFDISGLLTRGRRIMEVSRLGVHPRYRDSHALTLLSSGLTRFMTAHAYDCLISCASIAMDDGGMRAQAIVKTLRSSGLIMHQLPIHPHQTSPATEVPGVPEVCLPPQLEAYLSLGAKICDTPYWDKALNSADIFILLDSIDLAPRYPRRLADGTAARYSHLTHYRHAG